jgi:hypothetical protein
MSTAPVFKIVPGLQSYAWGKKGSSSLAAQLGSRSIPDFEIDDEKPYAEVCPLPHPYIPFDLGKSSIFIHSNSEDSSLTYSYGWVLTQTSRLHSHRPPPRP